jgi:hypothetical protein
VTIGNGSTVVITAQQALVSTTGWAFSDRANLHFEHLSDSAKETKLAGVPVIHIGSLFLPYSALYALIIERRDANGNPGGFEREVIFNGTRANGLAFSVGSLGNYSISFRSVLPGVVGRLHHNESFAFNADLLGDNFFSFAEYLLLPTLPTESHTATESPPSSAPRTPSVTETLSVTETPSPTATVSPPSPSASPVVWPDPLSSATDPVWRSPARFLPLIAAIVSGVVLVAYRPVEWIVARKRMRARAADPAVGSRI